MDNTKAQYNGYKKPAWAPPSWLFGPVWTVLYVLIALSYGTVLYKAAQGELPKVLALPIVLNLVFNIAYTPIQFRLRQYWLALLDVVLVVLTLVWSMREIYPHVHWAAYLLVPYLLWTSFATVLQASVTWLNRNKSDKKKLSVALAVIVVVVFGYVWYSHYKGASIPASGTATSTAPEYRSDTYGFSVALPEDWRGFVVATSSWEGDTFGEQGEVPYVRGPVILIRNPKWTQTNPYQDLPIMVFTLGQWNDLQADKYHIGAAPINPSELGRNTEYVFALPARYNFALLPGWEEVQAIVDSHPLSAF